MANDALGIRVIEFPLEASEEDLNASSKVLVDTPQGTKALDGDILGSLAPSIAEKFNQNKSYEDGDVVMHRGALRRFKGPHQGDWTDSDNDATDVVALIEEASTQYIVFPCAPEDLPDGDIIKGVVDAGLHPALKYIESANITYLPLTANYTQNRKEFLVFASGPFNIAATKNLESDSSEWEWSNKCPSDLRTAALETIAPSFKSRSGNNYTWKEGEVCVYDDGHLYVFIRDHEGPWTGVDVHETNIMEVLAMVIEKPTMIVTAQIRKDTSGTGNELYTYANNARTASVQLTADCIFAFMRKSGPIAEYGTQTTFKSGGKLKIKRARIVTPGSEGVASANGSNAADLYLQPYDFSTSESGGYYGLMLTKYNEWEDVNLEIDTTEFTGADYTLKLISSFVDEGVTYTTTMRVDDYNLQSAYGGQKLQAYLEIEVESEGIATT